MSTNPPAPNQPGQPAAKSNDWIKIAILVVVIVVCGVMLYLDRAVYTPHAQNCVDTLIEACEGQGKMTSDSVQELVGFAPAATESKDGAVTVETYNFRRAVPFMPGTQLFALYLDNSLKKVVVNRELTDEDINYVRDFHR